MPRLPRPPKWPVPQLATFELRDYRSALEHARQAELSPAEAERIDSELKKVLDEQLGRIRAERRSRQAEAS